MRFYFHPEAEREFDQAIQYYEARGVGLGLEFAEEVYAAISRVVEFPEAWTSMSPSTKRCLVNRFPFGLIFQINRDTLRIVAVANLHRQPGYWKGRV